MWAINGRLGSGTRADDIMWNVEELPKNQAIEGVLGIFRELNKVVYTFARSCQETHLAPSPSKRGVS